MSGFTGVSLNIPAKVEIVQDGIESDDNILPLIETVVEGDKLNVRFKVRNMSVSTKTLRMTINVKSLDSIAAAGSGDVAYNRDAKVSRSVAGSGSVKRLGNAPAGN